MLIGDIVYFADEKSYGRVLCVRGEGVFDGQEGELLGKSVQKQNSETD